MLTEQQKPKLFKKILKREGGRDHHEGISQPYEVTLIRLYDIYAVGLSSSKPRTTPEKVFWGK